jgi:hypothetical protein
VRWDSNWYYDIAKNGYSYTPSIQIHQENIAFFPLYPYLIRYFNHLIGDYYFSGILIANISFLLALIGLYLLISEKYTIETAQKTVLLLAFSPFSFYFSAMYSESLFLFSIVFVFFFAARKQWFLASLFAAAAGATRIVGIVSVLPILYFYMEAIRFDFRAIRWNILSVFIACFGPMSYMAYLWVRFGNPFVFLHVYKAPGWNDDASLGAAYRTLKNIFLNLYSSNGSFGAGTIFGMKEIHLIVFLFSIFLLLAMIKKIHPAYLIWAFATILSSFSGWVSMSRYMIVVFPLYLAAALLFHKRNFELVLAGSACLLSMFTILFSHWYWVS